MQDRVVHFRAFLCEHSNPRLGSRRARCTRRTSRKYSAKHDSGSAQFGDDETATSNLDVGEAVVNPTFRATPWQAEDAKDTTSGICIAFVSESNICRSPLAAAFMKHSLEDFGLSGDVEITSRATRDYTIGEGPHASTIVAANGLGVQLPADFRARKFDYTNDTVHFDLILVMDKFTAADVMREISVFDTINKKGNYSLKVRRLGEFHPSLREGKGSDAQDIDDPLYGNDGGNSEMESVARVAVILKEACEGLAKFLAELRDSDQEASLLNLLKAKMGGMQELDWLAPPMLSRR